MSSVPLRSTSTRSPNPTALLAQPTGERNLNLASSSASSSQIGAQASRADQVLYRFYLKTVQVLVDGRLTHYGGTVGKKPGDKKKDKWFNLILPEVDLYKSDLQIYRSISSYQPYTEPGETPSPSSCTVPPLLIAFILDTSDIPSGQALLWNRNGAKVPIDVGLSGKGKGKGKEKESKSGIVLERWTLRAQLPPSGSNSSSQLAPHTAYRLGIIHFRAVLSLIRLLPAYRLFRRLRRSNNGLRMGLKLWGPEGYPNTPEGLSEAWEIMERGLIGLDIGLDELVSGDTVQPEEIERYDFPKLDLFGNEFTLSAEYRPEVDFNVEDMEAVLSEQFVDMDEDWFTPTVSRRNTQEDPIKLKSEPRRVSIPTPTPIQSNNSPIPQRQPALPVGSIASGGAGSYTTSVRQGGSRVPASQEKRMAVGSLGTEKWGAFAEGLPFAGGASTTSQREVQSHEPPSPSMATPAAIVAARRLSGHSIQPFASASPSTSLLRSTPPQAYTGSPIPSSSSARPVIGTSRPSSVGRTSSFLSQSGRSFTHAQLANMYAGSASPPVTGAMSGVGVQIPTSSPPPGQSPVSPSSLSFTKQPVPRSISGRPCYMTPSASSPFIPESLERESPLSSNTGAPSIIKRYSSSLSQRSGRAISGPANVTAGSQGSSVGEGSLPGSAGQGLLRRTSTRESGLRHSLEGPGSASTRLPAPDEDDIQAFLKTLDALPQPPSIAAQAVQSSSRSHLPSTSSSLSAPSVPPTPSPLLTSSGSPGTGAAGYGGRVPMTRQQVDEELRRMAGSFSLNTPSAFVNSPSAIASGLSSPVRGPATGSGSNTNSNSTNPSSIGLLSASRPASANRRAIPGFEQERGSRPLYRRQTSGEKSPLGPGPSSGPGLSVPTSIASRSPISASPMTALKSADDVHNHTHPHIHSHVIQGGGARSLPGRGRDVTVLDEELLPARSAGITSVLSPQTTGTSATESMRSRRGPVLLRGGFGDPPFGPGIGSGRPSSYSSPSHSPVRDMPTKSTGVGLGIKESESCEPPQPQSQPQLSSGTGIGVGARSPYTIAARRSSGGISGYPGLPQSSGRTLKGQRTAPSSLGREDDANTPIVLGNTRRERDRSRVRDDRVQEEGMEELESRLSGIGIASGRGRGDTNC
ncbi:hypothetical protein I203_100714 [Kwoniella mangroviensis CBS 8507]|uniref:uncharacterized protein n=1 Tax=Kwoniella mangroviensis CBS 8507 TaxID=1296122 RepID=UPI00080CDDE1|nr:uncharacterized protein I203_06752 [Kwoniella mangroviensis CBS 8507]OCF64168.1 hypothetical protein I203_06752 [Kwoniella mangroviensis CBS 8507]